MCTRSCREFSKIDFLYFLLIQIYRTLGRRKHLETGDEEGKDDSEIAHATKQRERKVSNVRF